MKEIFITNKQGVTFTVLVDDEDFDYVLQKRWNVSVNSHTNYAQSTWKKPDGSDTTIPLHRYIMMRYSNGMTSSDVVDHINGNGLDNRKCNLRITTQSINAQNRHGLAATNTSGITGVNLESRKRYQNTTSAWRAFIWLGDNKKMSKSFSVQLYGFDQAKEMAIKQRKEWEKMYYNNINVDV